MAILFEDKQEEEFQLLAPKAKLFSHESGPVHHLLFQWPSLALERLLAVAVRPQNFYHVPENHGSQGEATSPDEAQRADHIMSQEAETDSNHAVSIRDLSLEIVLKVSEEVECMEDLICLGLVSRFFWGIARQRLQDYYLSLCGPWAGKNIVYAGELTTPGDLPPGLFSYKEADELISKSSSLYDIGKKSISKVQKTPPSIAAESKRLYNECKNRDRSNDPAFQLTYSELVCEDSTFFPENEPWILRNITTKEFVRSEAIAIKPEYIHGPFIEYLGFREVVVSRACWSAFSRTAMSDPTMICEGVWAGHQFDITTLARHHQSTQAAEW